MAAWYSPKEAGQDSSEEARPPETDGRWRQAAPPQGVFWARSLQVYCLVKGLSGVPTRNPWGSASWSLVRCWSLPEGPGTNSKPRASPQFLGSSSSHIRLLFQLLVLSNRFDLLRAILNFYITEAQEQTWLHLQQHHSPSKRRSLHINIETGQCLHRSLWLTETRHRQWPQTWLLLNQSTILPHLAT